MEREQPIPMRDIEVHYVKRDGAHIAYEIFGTGPIDLIVRPTNSFPIDLMWDLPQLAEFMDALGQVARVIAFDSRGVGASDPLSTTDPEGALEADAADMLAVLDATGCERPTLFCPSFGISEVGFAATYPQRVRSLILNSFRGWYPEMRAIPENQRRSAALWLQSPQALESYNPRVAHDPVVRWWWGRAHRLGGNPEQVVRQLEYASQLDVRPILEHVRAPTLVFHRQGDRMWDVESSRTAAALIPRARFVELAGSEHDLYLGDTKPVLSEIFRFLREPEIETEDDDRQLATVLFTDIVGSTEQLASIGDKAWRELLDHHDRATEETVASFRGRVVNNLGDGVLATFDGPARAVRCAMAIRDVLATRGMKTRAGVHTGEIELRGQDVAGMAVHTGARVAALAGEGDVLVSSTVKDLVGGSGIEFEERGEHELKGVPGSWRLFAVKG
jgi:class 3 adenylate cyclase